MEDVFHEAGHTRSKADYYLQHLFLKIMVHELTGQHAPSFGENIKQSPSAYDEKTLYSNGYSPPSAVKYIKRHSSRVDEEESSLPSDFSDFLKMVRHIILYFPLLTILALEQS